MKDDDILRWLIDFGTDWVEYTVTLQGTWIGLDAGILGEGMERKYIEEREPFDTKGYKWELRLTEKALARLDDGTNT